ncbi:Coagulation factor V [Nymphon striatum]|nr:Coagulation factor V [Nymphon striatum]
MNERAKEYRSFYKPFPALGIIGLFHELGAFIPYRIPYIGERSDLSESEKIKMKITGDVRKYLTEPNSKDLPNIEVYKLSTVVIRDEKRNLTSGAIANLHYIISKTKGLFDDSKFYYKDREENNGRPSRSLAVLVADDDKNETSLESSFTTAILFKNPPAILFHNIYLFKVHEDGAIKSIDGNDNFFGWDVIASNKNYPEKPILPLFQFVQESNDQSHDDSPRPDTPFKTYKAQGLDRGNEATESPDSSKVTVKSEIERDSRPDNTPFKTYKAQGLDRGNEATESPDSSKVTVKSEIERDSRPDNTPFKTYKAQGLDRGNEATESPDSSKVTVKSEIERDSRPDAPFKTYKAQGWDRRNEATESPDISKVTVKSDIERDSRPDTPFKTYKAQGWDRGNEATESPDSSKVTVKSDIERDSKPDTPFKTYKAQGWDQGNEATESPDSSKVTVKSEIERDSRPDAPFKTYKAQGWDRRNEATESPDFSKVTLKSDIERDSRPDAPFKTYKAQGWDRRNEATESPDFSKVTVKSDIERDSRPDAPFKTYKAQGWDRGNEATESPDFSKVTVKSDIEPVQPQFALPTVGLDTPFKIYQVQGWSGENEATESPDFPEVTVKSDIEPVQPQFTLPTVGPDTPSKIYQIQGWDRENDDTESLDFSEATIKSDIEPVQPQFTLPTVSQDTPTKNHPVHSLFIDDPSKLDFGLKKTPEIILYDEIKVKLERLLLGLQDFNQLSDEYVKNGTGPTRSDGEFINAMILPKKAFQNYIKDIEKYVVALGELYPRRHELYAMNTYSTKLAKLLAKMDPENVKRDTQKEMEKYNDSNKGDVKMESTTTSNDLQGKSEIRVKFDSTNTLYNSSIEIIDRLLDLVDYQKYTHLIKSEKHSIPEQILQVIDGIRSSKYPETKSNAERDIPVKEMADRLFQALESFKSNQSTYSMPLVGGTHERKQLLTGKPSQREENDEITDPYGSVNSKILTPRHDFSVPQNVELDQPRFFTRGDVAYLEYPATMYSGESEEFKDDQRKYTQDKYGEHYWDDVDTTYSEKPEKPKESYGYSSISNSRFIQDFEDWFNTKYSGNSEESSDTYKYPSSGYGRSGHDAEDWNTSQFSGKSEESRDRYGYRYPLSDHRGYGHYDGHAEHDAKPEELYRNPSNRHDRYVPYADDDTNYDAVELKYKHEDEASDIIKTQSQSKAKVHKIFEEYIKELKRRSATTPKPKYDNIEDGASDTIKTQSQMKTKVYEIFEEYLEELKRRGAISSKPIYDNTEDGASDTIKTQSQMKTKVHKLFEEYLEELNQRGETTSKPKYENTEDGACDTIKTQSQIKTRVRKIFEEYLKELERQRATTSKPKHNNTENGASDAIKTLSQKKTEAHKRTQLPKRYVEYLEGLNRRRVTTSKPKYENTEHGASDTIKIQSQKTKVRKIFEEYIEELKRQRATTSKPKHNNTENGASDAIKTLSQKKTEAHKRTQLPKRYVEYLEGLNRRRVTTSKPKPVKRYPTTSSSENSKGTGEKLHEVPEISTGAAAEIKEVKQISNSRHPVKVYPADAEDIVILQNPGELQVFNCVCCVLRFYAGHKHFFQNQNQVFPNAKEQILRKEFK